MIGVPASYARRLPAGLACINLQWNLEHHPTSKPDALILGLDDPLELAEGEPGDPVLRAMTGTTYGRIWDSDVVSGIRKATEGQPWKVPSASYASSDPKRATTLYASDRDVFIFLVDESRPIEVNGDTLYRGFYAWNSEVGSAAFGLTTFLYRYVCDNRIIWGATEVEELRIRHTGGAPDRFGREGARFLERYAKESSGALEGQIKGAQEKEIADSEKGVHEWLRKRGFSKSVAEGAVTRAKEDGDNPRNLWSIIQGLTAQARSDAHTDSRVDLERKAGRLMKYA
ncbi:MAG: DUF945 domain-containing protein [Verrucomicrobiae bacterium]|nr:DUF945 domain-containing protein [Verrucomicrobiae bacterium]